MLRQFRVTIQVNLSAVIAIGLLAALVSYKMFGRKKKQNDEPENDDDDERVNQQPPGAKTLENSAKQPKPLIRNQWNQQTGANKNDDQQPDVEDKFYECDCYSAKVDKIPPKQSSNENEKPIRKTVMNKQNEPVMAVHSSEKSDKDSNKTPKRRDCDERDERMGKSNQTKEKNNEHPSVKGCIKRFELTKVPENQSKHFNNGNKKPTGKAVRKIQFVKAVAPIIPEEPDQSDAKESDENTKDSFEEVVTCCETETENDEDTKDSDEEEMEDSDEEDTEDSDEEETEDSVEEVVTCCEKEAENDEEDTKDSDEEEMEYSDEEDTEDSDEEEDSGEEETEYSSEEETEDSDEYDDGDELDESKEELKKEKPPPKPNIKPLRTNAVAVKRLQK